MKRQRWFLGLVLVLTMGATVRAEPQDSFEESVDLKRFRTGNLEWDTQELIASGLTALHEENLRILRELEAIKSEIKQLKEHRK